MEEYILYMYPAIAYSSIQHAKDFAVQSMVFLETSYTAVSFPVVELDVHNYIGDMMTEEAPDYIEQYQLSPFKMKVQGLDRTLADKVFAICDYYLQGKVNGHSRHLYDIFKLLPLVPQNEEFRNLVQDVRSVRAESPVCPSAKEVVDVPVLLKKIIEENTYRLDYNNVTEKLLEDDLKYDDVIVALKTITENGMFA